ncbi:MAG: pantetheine-phosphate adenylyltransferase [Deltaproteobacteria bacterium]|nr:pantetheine-phosphate adenylyltransferase [Deltaproteobacteria bacterium]
MSQPRVGIYAGTFDPITNGHVDILLRALNVVDRLIVAVADNPKKQPMFSLAERVDLIRRSVPGSNVEIEGFSGLLVDFAHARNARAVIRGLRAIADFEFEFQLAHMNRHLAPDVETIYLMTNDESFFVSSSLVKEVAGYGGDVSRLVPAPVALALKERLSGNPNP